MTLYILGALALILIYAFVEELVADIRGERFLHMQARRALADPIAVAAE